MRTKIIFTTFTLCFMLGMAQEKSNIVKITYLALPVSQFNRPPESSPHHQEDDKTSRLAQSYRHYYTLYVNLETQQSVYVFDSLSMGKKPKGKEHVDYMINDNLDYVVKYNFDEYYKHEKIFQRDFYSQGTLKDIAWEITDEEKEIYGMACKKAVPKDKDLLMNAWYTTEIPVSSGPANFLGLPGLVVWAEDFFWTTEIENITYDNEVDFDAILEEYREKFDNNKKSNFIKEKLFLLKKSELVKSMLRQMR